MEKEWRPGRFLAWVGVFLVALGALQVVDGFLDRSVHRSLLWAVFVAVNLLQAAFVLPQKVVTTGEGLIIQRPFWRRTVVEWHNISDIRSVEDRPGSQLAVYLVGGGKILTGLHPVEHRGLVHHWEAVKDHGPSIAPSG